MASRDDISRARLGAHRVLGELESLDRSVDHCRDERLVDLLGSISDRKLAQSRRFLDWLGHPMVKPDPVAPTETADDPVSQPETSTGTVRVMEHHWVTPDLLIFKVPRPQDFQFRAGQSVKLGLGNVRRSYSIVSAPHEPFLEFFIEMAPGGQMSEQLRQLRNGDTLMLGQPKGGFTLHEGVQEHLMVATVTGINPFVSMVRDSLHRGVANGRFHLLHGASYQSEFGYRQELESLAAANPGRITYVPTVSRPDEPANAGWAGSSGRVDTIIDDYFQRAGLESSSARVYACGHSGMLDAVQQRGAALGFDVRTESYD